MPKDPIQVLLVEDNPQDVCLLKEALSDHIEPIEFVLATTFKEAIQKLNEAQINVVLIDLSLPDEHGVSMVPQMRKIADDLPIVVLTETNDPDIAVEAVRLGAQDYLVKGSFDADGLTKALRYAVERKKAQKESDELRVRLHHADRLASVGQLAAGVAHEINNPAAFILANLSTMNTHITKLAKFYSDVLNVIRPGAGVANQEKLEQLLENENWPLILGEMRDMIKDNLEGIGRIRSIVRDLKSFSRIEKESTEKVQINDVIHAACNMVFNEIRHRASLIKDLENVPEIVADRGKLGQVLMNLLVNAAQSIAPGATEKNRIKVTTRLCEDKVVVEVKDTGCGISQEICGKIFEPFFTTKSRETGTGLGLSLCAEIIRKHNGKISVKSEVGKGSCFTVELPVDTGLALEKTKDMAKPVPVSNALSLRILVIDDETALLKAMTRALKENHDVVTASGGPQALTILEKDQNFHVILCDLMMPEIDGIEVYNTVREKYPELHDRIIFTTGGAFTARAKEFLASVPNIQLEKPIRPADLRRALQSFR